MGGLILHYRIYIDVVFCINFVMDYIVIAVTDSILKCSAKSTRAARLLRRLAAAFEGALWVCFIILFRLYSPVWNVVTYFGICTLMIFTVAGKNRPSVILKGVAMLYLITCAMGGFIHVIYYYTTFGYLINSAGAKWGTANLWVAALGAVLFTPFIKWAAEAVIRRLSAGVLVYPVIIEYRGKSINARALCDTGNSLTDPYNGEPVNVAQADCIESLIGDYAECGYHLIPYSAIGSDNGLIPVVRFDRLTICDRKEKHIIERPLFAMYSGKFAGETEYTVIIHPKLMSGTKG